MLVRHCPVVGQISWKGCDLRSLSGVNRSAFKLGYGSPTSIPALWSRECCRPDHRLRSSLRAAGMFESYGSVGDARSAMVRNVLITPGKMGVEQGCGSECSRSLVSTSTTGEESPKENRSPEKKANPVMNAEKTHEDNNMIPEWRPAPSFSPSAYPLLSKLKLSSFVVLTAMAGYVMAPGILGPLELFFTALGTGLCALSANSFNQWVETPFDSQMARTQQRPLVRHILSQFHAFAFALLSGVAGVSILTITVNYVVALIGLFNIFLYAAVYTPLKRISIVNTWVGSVVGALPPIIGWGATGDFTSVGPYILAGMLFSWQFPHFCSLSWLYRADYAITGYKMMSVLNPQLNARVSLRYTLAMFALIAASCYFNLTSNVFLIDGGLTNLAITVVAYSFWKNQSARTAKSLFFASLVHLPIIMILMMIHKAPSIQNDDLEKLELEMIRNSDTNLEGQNVEQEPVPTV